MKKILTLALCMGVVGSMFAQKATVDQAAKLKGKADRIAESRSLIQQASQNPETANDVRTYYVGGKNEFELYDNTRTKQMINPKDKSIDPMAMAEQLLNGYKMYIRALPLDSVPDAKGKVKAKYSKEMIGAINGHFNDFFNAGGTFYNAKKYYPEAYDAFMAYGELPGKPYADKIVKAVPDSIINTAFFNAGLSAYAGNALPEAARAFKSARLRNSDNPQNYIYELACWQYMVNNDSTVEEQAKKEIEEIALAGFKKFGTEQMIFVNNIVNSYILENRAQEALDLVSNQIKTDPENPALYGLLGYIYDRMEKDDLSIENYKKAAAFENCDYETLKNAAKKLLKTGTEKLNSTEERSARQALKGVYFEPANAIVERAKSISKTENKNDSDLDYIIENITYALETYFK